MAGLGEDWEKQAAKVLNIAGSDASGYSGRLTEQEQRALDFLRSETEKQHPDHQLKEKGGV